jgi:lantibiotic modifying enzyme
MNTILPAIAPEHLKLTLDAIRPAIDAAAHACDNGTLWGGKAGYAVYYAALSRLYPERAAEQQAVQLLTGSLDQLAAQPTAAIARNAWTLWAARAVDGWLNQQENTEICRDLDQLLLDECEQFDSPQFNLISGLVALGSYAIAARIDSCGTEILRRVLSMLADLSQQTANEQWWPTSRLTGSPLLVAQFPQGYRDLGMAHGNPGVVCLLAQAVRHGLHLDSSQPMLEKSMNWLVAQQNPQPRASTFAHLSESSGRPSRCAWCYGDPGISWALSQAGLVLDRPDWLALARTTLDQIGHRAQNQMGFTDYALCHGRAGVGHILLRQANLLQQPDWLALGHELLGQSLHALTLRDAQDESFDNDSYLEGRAGIGLALMSAYGGLQLNWDAPLLPG